MSSKCDRSAEAASARLEEWKDEDLDDLESVNSGGESGSLTGGQCMAAAIEGRMSDLRRGLRSGAEKYRLELELELETEDGTEEWRS
jgi:hypothetical protein